jgi:polysaccharide export outer membrane protein
MQFLRSWAAPIAGMSAMLAVLAGCTLPRSGPTAGEIRSAAASEAGSDVHIVTVTPPIAAATRYVETLGFGSALVNAPAISPDVISPGDRLAVTVWENVDTGLLAGVGQKVTAVEEIQVDQSGAVFMPYVGRVQAAGRTPEALRGEITAALDVQTPDPQVEVRRVAGDGATVTVLGGVQMPGVYPIESPTLRLSAMLARAGGVQIVADIAQVKVERGGQTGRVWLQDLYDNPRLDVALRSGDRIIVEEDRRAFTALGATGNQARVPFNKRELSAVEAIAAAGGLDGRTADPTGVFIFREERSDVANRVLGRSDLVGPQQVAYVIDLTRADGLFSAGQFIIRDEDTVYVTEAPFAAWSRVLGVATGVVGIAGSVSAIEAR